jgi:glycosyltransferase involved in cell wall biosynthesis
VAGRRRGAAAATARVGLALAERLLAQPDHAMFWHLAVGLRLGRWMRSRGLRFVLTSAPPHSALVTGSLAKRASRGVWLADLRDPWFSLRQATPTSDLQQRIGLRLERVAASHADALMANTPRLAAAVAAQPGFSTQRVHLLSNAYDDEEVRRARERAAAGSRAEPFTILHAGTLYGGFRQPIPVLDAMAELRDRVTRPIRLVLAGADANRLPSEFARRMHELGLEDRVETPGFEPHEQILVRMARADVLLLLQGPLFRLQVPSKAYEYLAVGRPVLTLTSRDGATADLIRESGHGEVIEPDDAEGVRRFLERRLEPSEPDGRLPIPAGLPSRREVAGELAGVLDGMLERR